MDFSNGYGSEFTVTQETLLTKVSFAGISFTGAGDFDFVAKIYVGPGSTTLGDLLGTSEPKNSLDLIADPDYGIEEFLFTTPVPVSPGTTYVLTLETVDPDVQDDTTYATILRQDGAVNIDLSAGFLASGETDWDFDLSNSEILMSVYGVLLTGGAMNSAGKSDYELVAASQSDQAMGPTGAAGNVLERLIIIPETVGAGTVAIKDGSGAAINVFVTGTLADLKPFVIELGLRSTGGAWKITTGANVHVIAIGSFT